MLICLPESCSDSCLFSIDGQCDDNDGGDVNVCEWVSVCVYARSSYFFSLLYVCFLFVFLPHWSTGD
jgi:hypothetical protein